MKRILLAIVLLMGVSSVEAGFDSGNDLLKEMKDCEKYEAGQETHDNYYGCGASVQYIVGVYDAYETLQKWKRLDDIICMPSGVTGGQLKAIVRKHLDNGPEDLHMAASSIVLNSLTAAFPCE